MNPASITRLDLVLAAPELFVLAATCVVLLVDLFLTERTRWLTFVLSLLTLAGASWLTTVTGFSERTVGWHGTYVADPLSSLLKIVAYGAVAVAFLYGHGYLQVRRILKGEYYVLGLFALLGIMVLVSANSLVTLYLGVELLALSLYALVAFNRESGIAAEAAIKYFVLGSIASGALLYGMSIIYGVTGSLELGVISNAALQMPAGQIGLLFGLAFIVVGVAFKFGAVPFHTWVPDVYHGAPTPVTLFLAAAPKLGSFALAFRLLAEGLGAVHATGWQDMITMVAVLSIIVGNVVAIAQTNIKRMLAYSTISHVGFILLGILAGTSQGYSAALYYTITYVIMSVGGFGMVILLSRKGFEADSLEDFKGLNARNPWFAAVMLMLMFSMAGVPPFVGFWAKLAVIQAVLNVGSLWLAIVAVALSVVGAYYYLRVVKLMYFDEPTDEAALQGGGGAMRIVLSLNGLAVLALGLYPGLLLELCARVIP
ncbi:MAG: NADH-quinone oxidoreductase subunit NuoN [Steroidobacteraceae bacterium]|nr:NADH-quinone oxidoreductase subunit NuoN [Pseudomonadota bacterium]MBP6106745.1 NADH-quinone oxidoreductase subunit NuoN [Steroidobacteraceae bacterium]MBP7013152.1 NADH-quinone oxidoreductase subunit NuoN [Steroidobacteraceae bacterium]